MPRALARSPYTIIEAKRPDLMYRLVYQVQSSLMIRTQKVEPSPSRRHICAHPGMPVFQETALYAKLAAAGAAQNLLQRLYPGYGHCVFPATAVAQHSADLVTWVTTGVKPAG